MSDDPLEDATSDGAIVLHMDAAHCVNFASAQNDIPVVRAIKVENQTEDAFEGLTLRLSATPPVIQPKSWTLDHLGAGEEVALPDLSTTLDTEKLAGLNEAERGILSLVLSQGEDVLAEETRTLDLLAKDQWGGLGEMDRLLAAYVSPNDPAVAKILKEASRLLEAAGHDRALEGYQSQDPGRAWMQTGAVWAAVTGLGLTYANPPASFEIRGQKIRFPDRIQREGLATCLDTSLLLVAAWEQIGLHPTVLFSEGHAFAGVWLMPKDFGAVTEPDVVAVRKAIQAREFVVVETTFVTKRPAIGFAEAVEAGRALLAEDREHEFSMAVDVSRARAARIRPLASHISPEDERPAEPETVAPAGLPQPLDFGMLPDEREMPVPETPRGRIERWQGKLLDLSLRNRLLNYKTTKQTVPCRVPDVGALEDALANGRVFRAFPLFEDDPIGERRVSPEERARIIDSAATDAFDRGQVTVDLDKSDMDKRLLALFRKAKSDLQEGGTNTLFMAAGFLRWQREGDPKAYRAPLLLIPIKLERRSARSEFRIKHHEDEVRFNATLLEFLKRDFDLTLPALEGELPTDDSGIDIPRVFELLRSRIRDVPGFEVVEEIAISTFSFAKYLMWKDLVDRTDDLRSNRLVAHLVDNPDEAFDTGVSDPIPPQELDRRVPPKDLFTPLAADSSQLAAVVAASTGKDFVLIGPPGTGKSQTIANIICQCIASGKTVLFVAEKAAALDVVQRRLEAHGLGDAVLELHSNKADRKRVLTQLGRGWDRASGLNEDAWIEINEKLQVERDTLNAYVAALHEEGTQGFSIFDALGWSAPEPKGFALSFETKDAHDVVSFARLKEIAETLERTYQATKDIPPLSLIAAEDWSFSWENEVLDAARTLRLALDRAINVAQSLAGTLGLEVPGGLFADRFLILDQLAQREGAEAADLRSVPDMPARDLVADVERFTESVRKLETDHAALAARYSEDEIVRMPLDSLDADWRAAQASMWPVSAMRRRKVQKLLQSYAESGSASPAGDIAALRRMRSRLAELAENPLTEVAGPDRSVSRLNDRVAQATDLRDAIRRVSDEVSDGVAFGEAYANLIAGADDGLAQVLRDWRQASVEFKDANERFHRAGGVIPDGMDASAILTGVDLILSNRDRLADWTRWREARAQADTAGLTEIADRMERGELTVPASEAFKRAYARWWLPLALDASEPLRRFVFWDHEDRIQAFRDLDDKAAELAPIEVMRRINHRLPARDGVPRNSELGTLRHQLGLQRPSMAIRPLLGNLRETLPKLAPCVLMSPLSIAQYLPAGQPAFDVVIFDEASQITTWDAVGAIARARQSIIVGDPKQLPPTNFFGRTDDGDDDIDPYMQDMPSILDEVANAGIPTRRLDWHYRSRDEALIAFSNHFYYDGGLVTFPAPATGSDAVKLHKIDGTYARGRGRTNQDEAKAVVAMIARRLTHWVTLPEGDRPTLGVITFNAQQQGLILDLLDDLRRNRTDLEWFFEDAREEPVIVKNLENIQGDERDVMLFSITFGPDAAGKLSMAFGALNLDGGGKRLNVAVTRARRELHVFSSITADQIDLSRTRATGVRDLKSFLDYAARGPVALPAQEEGSLGPAENPFEASIAEAFRAKGWEVRTQVGVSGFRIDLGIVNPDHAGAYLAGIECDGATYHSAATARDRDKVRQAVLEGLGWTILRIWSTDWFRDAGAVVTRVHEKLEELLQEDRARRAEEEAAVPNDDGPALSVPALLPSPEVFPESSGNTASASPIPPDPSRQQTLAASLLGTVVQEPGKIPESLPLFEAEIVEGSEPGTPALELDPDEFFAPRYLPTLSKLIDDILSEKAPMPLSALAREVARRHGWQRTGRRINTRVEQASRHVETRAEGDQTFLWPEAGFRVRTLYRGLEDRWIQDVSQTEIASVLDEINEALDHSEDPILDLARELGIARLSASARDYLDNVYRWYRSGGQPSD